MKRKEESINKVQKRDQWRIKIYLSSRSLKDTDFCSLFFFITYVSLLICHFNDELILIDINCKGYLYINMCHHCLCFTIIQAYTKQRENVIKEISYTLMFSIENGITKRKKMYLKKSLSLESNLYCRWSP